MSLIAINGMSIARRARSKPEKLTPSQVRRRRNEDWRIDHEVGRLDPVTDRLICRSTRLIADLAGVSERTVRLGIAEARKVREAIAAYAHE